MTRLSSLMHRMQDHTEHWTDWFPNSALLPPTETYQEGKPFFVDVGGRRGHDLSALVRRLKGYDVQLFLHDLPGVIDECVRERQRSGTALDPRIALSRHDFFKPQPRRGAKLYYLHKIMHDCPDADCVSILARLKEAMDSSSRILINDVVLLHMNAPLL